MADPPKTTAEIIAAIRKQAGGAAAAAPSAPAAPAEPEVTAEPAPEPQVTEPVAETPPAPVAAATPGEAPKGTASILAAIRAKGPAPAGSSPAPATAKPAATGGDAPKGTASILASIRGGGGAAPAAKPAAATAAKPAPPKPAGDKPSVQEMIRAVKEGVKVPAPGQPKVPTRFPGGRPAGKADVVVVKPGAAGGKPVRRRSVFAPVLALVSTPFAFAWTMMSLLTGAWLLKTAQFMMPNMVLELPSRFKVGVSSDYPLGTVSEKYKASRGVWIVHTDSYDGRDTIYALASVCTHLGCTPNWLEGEQKFKCPCHGSGFYINGINFEGPAPRPLERVGLRVSEDGQLEVDKSVKFQEELGQWADTKSFVELA